MTEKEYLALAFRAGIIEEQEIETPADKLNTLLLSITFIISLIGLGYVIAIN